MSDGYCHTTLRILIDGASLDVLRALLQKLVGGFFVLYLGGNFGGNFSDPLNKGSKNSGTISEHFS